MKLTNKDITMWISYSFLALFADLPCLYHIDHVWANHPVYYRKNNRGQCSWTDEGRGCYFTLGIMALPQHTAVKLVYLTFEFFSRSLCRLSVTMNRSTETYFKAFNKFTVRVLSIKLKLQEPNQILT